MQIAVLLALLVATCYAQLEQSDAALVEPSETGRVRAHWPLRRVNLIHLKLIDRWPET